jgi:hypothetical protein
MHPLPSTLLAAITLPTLSAAPLTTANALVEAVRDAGENATIELAPGTYELDAPLDLHPGMTLKGAGVGKTVLTHTAAWTANPQSLPDPETNHQTFDRSGYLLRLADNAAGITISDLTLTGPRLHGAIFGWGNKHLHLHHLRIADFQYAGLRTYATEHANIHDCTFVDAGQRWEKGGPGLNGGITGGGIFVIWIKDSEIHHNRFLRTKTAANEHYYGIKGRQGIRLRIHHNTIETNFSIEFPFENDEDVEIDHNILHGTVSIPKHAGGPVPGSGRTFHIHHNHFRHSYSIEFVRNGVEIDHNLFDFDTARDGGNLISGFGQAPAKGPAVFHNNLVSNPGRGVIWINEPYNGLVLRNNHIITRTTATPRTEGLFGFHAECDFGTFQITDNIIECEGRARPLVRNDESAGSTIRNNSLANVSDTGRYENPTTGRKPGLEEPLMFRCGVHDELAVNGWVASPADKR